MKKSLFLTAILAVFAVAAAVAQPRAVGGRLGWNLEASYQHSVGDNFVEIDAGLIGYGQGVQATAIYDWVWLSPNWTPKGTWNWYSGIGGTVGYGWPRGTGVHTILVGAAANIGLEYQFWFPLTLSFDYRPTLGVALGTAPSYGAAAAFYVGGLYDFALSARYAF